MLAQTIQLALDAALTRKQKAETEWGELLDSGATEREYTPAFQRFKAYDETCEALESALISLAEAEPKA